MRSYIIYLSIREHLVFKEQNLWHSKILMIQNIKNNPHVYVALSGGVDSAVSAALLQEAGYRVTGAFIKTWQPPFLECRAPLDREDARRVAAHLGIGFTTVDLEETYKQEVVDYMVREYSRGRTPNPDVICNQQVKFGAFFKEARNRGADFIATGHYARVQPLKSGRSSDAAFGLWEGIDKEKDQSYFLWSIGREQLSRTIFPVGEMHKSEVRAYAGEHDLPVADKKDSQGVCFLGKLDMKEFLAHFVEAEPGSVVNTAGEIIGRHDGAIFYTSGQRRGFEVTAKGTKDGPHYVFAKDMDANTITVGTAEEQAVYDRVNCVALTDTNWISGVPVHGTCEVRYRYRQPKRAAKLYRNDAGSELCFSEAQKAVMPGQSAVVYDGEHCLGGGIIDTAVYTGH